MTNEHQSTLFPPSGSLFLAIDVCNCAQEPYLFGMALRAIGNLTRCDENISRVVGFGVIKGIVEGMAANAEISSVIQLAADVMGNLGSLDDEDGPEGVEVGVKVLKEGLEWRRVSQLSTMGHTRNVYFCICAVVSMAVSSCTGARRGD